MKIDVQLLEMDDLDVAIGKVRVLLLLFKSDTTPYKFINVSTYNRYEDMNFTEQPNRTKPNAFHEAVCKTEIDP